MHEIYIMYVRTLKINNQAYIIPIGKNYAIAYLYIFITFCF
jgi:hypothetical protein